jgi:hypothetical protein
MTECYNFIQNEENQGLIKIIQNNESLDTWQDVQNKWQDFTNKLTEMDEKIVEVEFKLKNLQYINVVKKELYRGRLKDLDNIFVSNVKLIATYEEYCRNIFRNISINKTTISEKEKKINKTLVKIQVKINILNDISSQISISDYYRRKRFNK